MTEILVVDDEPAVRVAAWESPDGRRAYVAVNWTLKTQRFSLSVPVGAGRRYVSVVRKSDSGGTRIAQNAALPYVLQDTLPPCRAALYEVR